MSGPVLQSERSSPTLLREGRVVNVTRDADPPSPLIFAIGVVVAVRMC